MFIGNFKSLHLRAEIGPDGLHDLKLFAEWELGDFGNAHEERLVAHLSVIQRQIHMPARSISRSGDLRIASFFRGGDVSSPRMDETFMPLMGLCYGDSLYRMFTEACRSMVDGTKRMISSIFGRLPWP